MIDQTTIKNFWDSRAKSQKSLPFESIVNLEEDPELLQIKIQDENAKVFSYLNDIKGKTILDLGAGIGLWSFRFIEKNAAYVDAVEYSTDLCEIGRRLAAEKNMKNITFHTSPAENFFTVRPYDLIFISGLFVYLTDTQAALLLANIKKMLTKNTQVFVRDGTGLQQRFEIINKFSENIGAYYSAVYRTSEEYIKLFHSIGLNCVYQDNMFPEGHILNKYPETRLKVYSFKLT